MSQQIDLESQVQNELKRYNGGTGTQFGAGTQVLLVPWVNDTSSSKALGSIITRTPSIALATNPASPIMGVVAGRYSPTTQQFEEVAPAASEMMALAVAGIANVLTASASTRGQYVRPSSTAGQAEPTDALQVGSFGWVLHATSSSIAQVAFLVGGMASAGGYYTINVIFNGSGTPPPVGEKLYVSIDAPGTIVGVRMEADVAGDAVLDIKNFGTLGAIPGSSIVGGNAPTLSSARTSAGSIAGWTTGLDLGDSLEFSLSSISLITSVTCALKVARS